MGALKRTELKRNPKRPSETQRTCQRPGCPVTFYRHHSITQHYCTRECRDAHLAMKRRRVCRQCGAEFQADTSLKLRVYCSVKCQGIGCRHDRKRKCVICGETFETRSLGAHTRKTCSAKCAREATRRGKLGKKNPMYRNGRATNRERWRSGSSHQCCCCGSTDRLRLHHVVYEQHVRKRGGDCWDPRNGLTLCMSCHSRHHARVDSPIPLSAIRRETFEFAAELLGEYAVDYFFRYYHAEREDVLTRLPQQLQIEVA